MNLNTFRELFRKISFVYIQLRYVYSVFISQTSITDNYSSYQQLVSGPVN